MPFSEDSPDIRREKKIDWNNLRWTDLYSPDLQTRRYFRGEDIVTREVPVAQFLRNISTEERHGLVHLFRDVFQRVKRSCCWSLMAVGTTTYGDDYWQGLSKYLEDEPSLQDYASRRGEDIDLILMPSMERMRDDIKLAQRDLDQSGLDWKLSDQRDNGARYMSIPEEHQEEYGAKVLRRKEVQHCQNFVINIPGCRPFHLEFTHHLDHDKLQFERTQGGVFSLLYRHNAWWDLRDEIEKLEAQTDFFDTYFLNTVPQE